VKYTLRALLAVSLLVGFFVAGLAIVVALAYAGYLASSFGASLIAGGLWILAVVVAVAISKSMFSEGKPADLDQGSVVLGEAEQPELWREVRELAAFAATRAPDEIRLFAGVNAGVAEETKVLGLVGGTRRLALGAPLLIGLTRQQLRSVVAHELGHYSGRHTALGALTYRGKEAIGRVLNDLEGSFVRRPLELYARLYLAVSHYVNRRQEFEADRLGAELVGPATAAEALRQTEALEPAWRLFVERYVAPGWDVGRRPRDFFDGFRRFVADPERQRQLAEVRVNWEDPPRSIYDSHPPTAERLAAFGALEDGGDQADTSEPAVTILSDPQADLARLGEAIYRDSHLEPAEFEEIVALASRSSTAHNARFFLEVLRKHEFPSATLGGAVSALKEGRPEALLSLVHGDPGENDPDDARRAIAALLGEIVAHSLLEDGSARYELDWGGQPRLVDRAGQPLDPWAPAFEALTADHDAVEAFEAWLDGHGVRRDLELPPLDRAADRTPSVPTRWLGVLAPVNRGVFTRRAVFGVADSGVLVCKPREADQWAASIALLSFRDDGRTYAKRLLAQQPGEVLAESRARHLRWAEIAAIAAHNGRFFHKMLITASDGSTSTIKWSSTAHVEGEVWAALGHYLGDRFTVANPRG
jgi:Zn-dependent protease with chaperone function